MSLITRPRGRFSVALAAAILVVGGGVAGVSLERAAQAAEPSHARSHRTQTTAPVPANPVLSELQDGFMAVADRMEPSVVSIRVEKTVRQAAMGPDDDGGFSFPGFPGFPGVPGGRGAQPRSFTERGEGSGVIVRPDGWILTNDHVAGGADKVIVKLNDGREYTGTVRRDYRSDLALVKIDANNLPAAQFANSDDVRVGQWAIAFGAPYGLSQTMTTGIISARQRQMGISEGGDSRFYPSLLQTDAPINPGNSGGPLVDIHGRVVGIDVAINSPNGGSVGIGFAIPSNTARNVVDQLVSRGSVVRGFLGLAPRSLTPDDRAKYHIASGGAVVEQVSPDTPASRAGLQANDVIVRFNGRPVRDDIAFRDMVAGTAPGTRVDLVVRRGGSERTLTATLGTAPSQPTQ